jgi:UDP-N-acetylmuramate dehydrogenase
VKSESVMLMKAETVQRLEKVFGDRLERQVPLAPLTTIRIGGPAELLYRAQSASELAGAVDLARGLGIRFWLLGGGSNLVISDEGLPGLVIVDANREKLEATDKSVTASSGYLLGDVVEVCRENALTGFEFAAGIPGGVGGAVCGNAGAYGCTVGDILTEATVWTAENSIQKVPPDFFQFEYRESVFKRSEGIVLEATFRVEPGKAAEIEAVMEKNLQRRLERLPSPKLPSAGSFFKNLPPEKPGQWRRPAGKFLEEAGVLGLSVGGARVFEKHANIIVNAGGATARDVRRLAGQMRELVYKKFGILLEEEARYLGDIPSE